MEPDGGSDYIKSSALCMKGNVVERTRRSLHPAVSAMFFSSSRSRILENSKRRSIGTVVDRNSQLETFQNVDFVAHARRMAGIRSGQGRCLPHTLWPFADGKAGM